VEASLLAQAGKGVGLDVLPRGDIIRGGLIFGHPPLEFLTLGITGQRGGWSAAMVPDLLD
jgi:hypothetical protein